MKIHNNSYARNGKYCTLYNVSKNVKRGYHYADKGTVIIYYEAGHILSLEMNFNNKIYYRTFFNLEKDFSELSIANRAGKFARDVESGKVRNEKEYTDTPKPKKDENSRKN